MPSVFQVWSSFPGAPYTSQLVLSALKKHFPEVEVISSDELPVALIPKGAVGSLLQWSTYDALSHELSLADPIHTLSSSYTIRKSLIRKHFLHRSLHSYVTKHPDSYLATEGSVPKTYDIDISFADELDEMWGDELWDLGRVLDMEEDTWWILKPSMADRGMGIRLFDSRDALRTIFERFEEDEDNDDGDETEGERTDTSVMTSQLRHFVIQVSLCIDSKAPSFLTGAALVGIFVSPFTP